VQEPLHYARTQTFAYPSPEASKQAIEQRLRTSATSGAEFAHKRQLLVFDGFLAGIVAVLGDAATRIRLRFPKSKCRRQCGV
jgi:hypothetical protein